MLKLSGGAVPTRIGSPKSPRSRNKQEKRYFWENGKLSLLMMFFFD